MLKKFKFKLSEKISVFDGDMEIIFQAELQENGDYLVTWDSEIIPMADGTEYTVSQADNAIKVGHWILLD